MDTVSCPRCRSSLYSPSHNGWSCLDCGYKQRTRGADTPKVPQGEKTESRFSRIRAWNETRDWKQSKAMWRAIRPARAPSSARPEVPRKPKTLKPKPLPAELNLTYSQAKRAELNETFKKAQRYLEAYKRRGNAADLTCAKELADICLAHAHGARTFKPLHELNEAIRAQLRLKKRA